MDLEPLTRRPSDTAVHWLITLGIVGWFYAVGIFALVTAGQPSPLAGIVVVTPPVLLFAWVTRP